MLLGVLISILVVVQRWLVTLGQGVADPVVDCCSLEHAWVTD